MNRSLISSFSRGKMGLLMAIAVLACIKHAYGFDQSRKIHVKLSQSVKPAQAEAFTVAFQVSDLDSIRPEFVVAKLAYNRNKICPKQVRLNENLAKKWLLVDHIIKGKGTVDTLWFGMISQYALQTNGDVVHVDFVSSHNSATTHAPWIVSAAFATQAGTFIAAVEESKDRLLQIDQTKDIPLEFGLDQNYPNPFNAGTRIEFRLPRDSHIKITVANIVGQIVASLIDQKFEAGEHYVMWDAKMQNGQDAASGIYIYTIQTNQFRLSRKMLLMR
jgi:hypothetical protein